MKRSIVFYLLFGLIGPSALAQISFDLQLGTSRRDYSLTTFRVNYQLNDVWRIGGEFQASDYRYRFIDARKIENGFASETRVFALGRLAENNRIRLDFFLKTGWRTVNVSEDEPQQIAYDFENSSAILVDPGLLVTLKATENLFFHTGVHLPLAFQIAPEFIGEQLQSNYILFGGSYALSERWVVLAHGFTGATFGANGDAEKYMWQTSVGVRFSLKGKKVNHLIVGY